MYNRLKELLEQALLEFDPNKHPSPNTFKVRSAEDASHKAASKEMARTRKHSKSSFFAKNTVRKVADRALARGAAGKKRAGPKGKLPK